MPVYVDPLMDHGWRLGPSCHLWADSLPELHVFATSIGLKPAWFQPDTGRGARALPHYDLTASRRAAAVAAGAIPFDRRAAVADWRSRRAAGLPAA